MADPRFHISVFKDQFPIRTFKIHPAWMLRVSLGFLGMAAIATLCVLFSARIYRQALRSNPVRIQELERELTELRLTLQNQKIPPTPVSVTPPGTPAAPQPPATIAKTAPGDMTLPLQFLPASLRRMPSGAPLSIELTDLKTRWTGSKHLRVQFNIQYSKGDGGNQQGRIVVVARGANQIFVYPEGSISTEASSTLLTEESGEHFSVSRFRGVMAQFGPFSSTKEISWIDIFLFSDAGELLIHRTVQQNQISTAKEKPTVIESPNEE